MDNGKVNLSKAAGNKVASQPVKTGGATKGFGGGSASHTAGHTGAMSSVTKGSGGKAPVKGFSGGGLLGGKV